jgi:dTDP-4-amino-4,6-dideoxygalactose transaminase
VVEDAAQAIGAARGGRPAGSWGSAGCFSFYPTKNLGAAGDGGCVTTDDEELAERLLRLRSHGAERPDHYGLPGTTSRLDSLQAALLRAKLPHLKRWTEGRARNAALYAEALEGLEGLLLPERAPGEEPVWNQYVLRLREPQPVRRALEAAGIEWRCYYPVPAYRQPALGSARLPAGACPEAERACAEATAIPVRPSLRPDEVREIAGVIRAALGG